MRTVRVLGRGTLAGLFFPTAARILPGGGTAMYAMLALAGDIGCSAGPTLVGTVAGAFGEDLRPAMIFAVIFLPC